MTACFRLASVVAAFCILNSCSSVSSGEDSPSAKQVEAALILGAEFFATDVMKDGGYVWKYTADLKYWNGEGLAYDNRIWIQPPGTPAIGIVLLDVWERTGNPKCLDAALKVGGSLVKGQLHSGGWPYSVSFQTTDRKKWNYRVPPSAGEPKADPKSDSPGGWKVWRKRKHRGNMSILDDDTTQAALRFLVRLDQALEFKEKSIHEAAMYGLDCLMRVQYPIGAWSHNYDSVPKSGPDASVYPVINASYPDKWSRNWTKNFSGCYYLNDRITLDAIKTLILAGKVYKNQTYMDRARRGGEFLIRAQFPSPQSGWAQQYDEQMHPVWDRGFEPPSLTAFESQTVLHTLMDLYVATDEKRFLKPIPSAIEWLKRSELDDGRLARFYELQTNKPLYFTKSYQLTYDRKQMPDHYAFVVDSEVEAIETRYDTIIKLGKKADLEPRPTAELQPLIEQILASQDKRGAWTEPGFARDAEGRKKTTPQGIINSQTFIDHMNLMLQYLRSVDASQQR